jgi:hypothetical protein
MDFDWFLPNSADLKKTDGIGDRFFLSTGFLNPAAAYVLRSADIRSEAKRRDRFMLAGLQSLTLPAHLKSGPKEG